MSSFLDDPVSASPNPPPNLSKPPNSSDSDTDDEPQTFHDALSRFTPADEASLVSESNTTKSEANTLFSEKRYSEAISTYDRALASCPNYLDYEIAVLKSNISACHIQLEEWKTAVDSATEALGALDKLDPLPKQDKDKRKQQQQEPTGATKSTSGTEDDKPDQGNNNGIVEIPDDEDETTALHRLSLTDTRRVDIARIRTKSLLRRARARHRQQTWATLAGAEEDYKLLLRLLTNPTTPINQSKQDLATVRNALKVLPDEIGKAKEKEMGEMMGKLKELGNGILKPFGLSTENFKMVKDEKSGGYSMNFEGGGGGK
jgi:tetratricopeptide (TPR) repeat protein